MATQLIKTPIVKGNNAKQILKDVGEVRYDEAYKEKIDKLKKLYSSSLKIGKDDTKN